MPDASRRTIRRTTVIYWMLLIYIIAALAWWFISLEKQNNRIAQLQYQTINPDKNSLSVLQYGDKVFAIDNETKRNTGKYIAEGITFLILILIGAVFVYRSISRQLKIQQQQQNFMMAITHELKTPISVARLNLETLQKYNLDEEKKQKIIRTTLDETSRLDFLTNNILVAAQLENSNFKAEKEELDLTALLKDCIRQFNNRFPERIFVEDIEYDTDIKGDSLLLQMLINNLLENATKYSPRESPISTILKRTKVGIELQIKDQGIGIEETEKAKIELSTAQNFEVNLPFLDQGTDGPINFEYNFTRAKLEDLVKDLIEKTVEPCKKALKDAKLSGSDIHEVILVGGMTRMPAVQAKVKEIFGKEPKQGVNPDEVVAMGAAIQGGVLQGDVKDVLLLDVTPLSLGIETMGGVSTKLIERNTTVPTSKSETFSTAADNQPQVEFHVLQGEREMAEGNKSLGRFILDGIPPAPRGIPQIEVTFNIDANGILNVTAKDKGTSKEQSITIQNSGNLSKDDIEKAQKEAEAHAEEDKKKKEAVEAKNGLENAIYQAEKMPDEMGDKISDEDKEAIKKAVETAKEKKDSDDKDELEAAAKGLLETIQPIATKMYEEAAKSDEASTKDGDKDKEDAPEAEVIDEDESR